MPELPEVEAAAQYVRERIVGCTITGTEVLWGRTLATGSPAVFKRRLVGSVVENVQRRGKFIVISLRHSTGPMYLLFHLRMSGSLDVLGRTNPVEPHDRLIVSLDSDRDLRFNDIRKFGRCYFVDDISEITGNLGFEPLVDEFSKEKLFELLRRRRGRIKSTLLDQTFIAGIGNIYADESLWLAKIHPSRPCDSIQETQSNLLWHAIREVLGDAIGKLGTDFGDGVVHGGMYAPKAYGRTGKPCDRCGAKIRRILVGQRSTHFCPKCQRPPRG